MVDYIFRHNFMKIIFETIPKQFGYCSIYNFCQRTILYFIYYNY